jgi:diadenosine tetraphosphate (Ap4A) HIT family hydrolase
MTSTDDDCPFCAIVKTYPHPALNITPQDSDNVAYIVLSTPHILAVLDRLPLTKYHTIIIPRAHFELLSDIPSPYAAELGKVLPVISRAVVEVSGADGFNVVQNNGISFNTCGLMGKG